jgi:hypothetical protein
VTLFQPIIEGLSEMIEQFNAASLAAGSFLGTWKLLLSQSAQTLADPGAKLNDLRKQLDALDAQAKKPGYGIGTRLGSQLGRERADLQKEIDFLKDIQRQRALAGAGNPYSNEGRGALVTPPRIDKSGAARKEEIDAQTEALARFVAELENEATKLEDITVKEKLLRFLRANPNVDTAAVRSVLAYEEQILDLRQRAVAAKKEDEEIEKKILGILKSNDEQLDRFSGRADEALKIALRARLEARIAAGELFSDDEMKKMVDGISKIGQEVEKVNDEAKSLALTFASSIGQFIEDPKQGNFFKALGKDIEKLIVQLLIVKPLAESLEKIFSGAFGDTGKKGGGSAGGAIWSSIFSFFGGFFADGGTLGRGQWGIAGERGPELIYGGTSGMSVMPAGAGGATTVNVYIDAAADRARVASMVQAGVQAGLARSADSRARGGSGVRS